MNKTILMLLWAAGAVMPFSFKSLSESPADEFSSSKKRGAQLYEANCIACHQVQGEGVDGVFPPLAKSDYLLADRKRAVRLIIRGLSGEIKVNSKSYNGDMPAQELTDQQVADVLTYITNSWGNKAKMFTVTEVKTERNRK